MSAKTKRMISIITFIGAIFVECIACLLWLIPISGFMIYPFVCGFAVLLSIVSWIFAKGNKILRVLNCAISIMPMVTIIADVILLVGFVTGFNGF